MGVSRVKVSHKTQCWEWQGAIAGGSKTESGYPTMGVDGKSLQLHRIVYAIFVGSIPWRNCVMHKCDNRVCINPSHLTVGTLSENAKDMWRKNRGVSGERNKMSKLKKRDVLKIRKMYKEGDTSYKKLGDLFGVCPQAIYLVVKKKNWKHI